MSCNILLVAQPDHVGLPDFECLADLICATAPDVHAFALQDQAYSAHSLNPAMNRPTMIFSPVPLRYFTPWRGKVFQCRRLAKSQEYLALQGVGVPVPKWTLLTPDAMPELADFGPYVVVKPDASGKGADVKIKRRDHVRWQVPRTDYTRKLQGENGNWVVQEFVYTGAHPVSYRVTTLFGEPLWAWKVQADSTRRVLKHRYGFYEAGGMSIVSSGKGSVFSLIDEPEMSDLARQAHSAFPSIPVLAVDIVRDADTGQLFVIEVNAGGYTWHVSSSIGRKIQKEFGFDINAQCHVYRKAAKILVAQARRYAC